MPSAQLLSDYRAFEARVNRVMSALCAPFCRVCPTPCCRKSICQEANDSPFLRAVHGAKVPFSSRLGYLGHSGCRLPSGRPPICHAFVCHTIKQSQPSDHHRYAIDCLGDLIDFIGSGTCRRRHLVEALTAIDLQRVDVVKFQKQLTTAEMAFSILDRFFQTGNSLSAADLHQLAAIRPFSY